MIRVIKMLTLLGLAGVLVGCASNAKLVPKENIMQIPHGCEQVGYRYTGNLIALNSEYRQQKQRLYLFFNNYNKRIIMSQQGSHPILKFGTDTKISPQHWAAFAVAKDNIGLACMWEKRDKMVELPCKQIMRVCEIVGPRFMVGTQGTYWLVEDAASSIDVKKTAKRKGVSW